MIKKILINILLLISAIPLYKLIFLINKFFVLKIRFIERFFILLVLLLLLNYILTELFYNNDRTE